MRIHTVSIICTALITCIGCTTSDNTHEFYFASKHATVALEGEHVDSICTPTFLNQDEFDQILNEKGMRSFYQTYCPGTKIKEGTAPVLFPYLTDAGAYQQWNPGGYLEINLYSNDDIDRLERETTRDPQNDGSVTTWTTCERGTEMIAPAINALTLTCTSYYQQREAAKPNAFLPNTDCFVPVSENVFFGIRIPMAAMDSNFNTCSVLREWGVTAVTLK